MAPERTQADILADARTRVDSLGTQLGLLQQTAQAMQQQARQQRGVGYGF